MVVSTGRLYGLLVIFIALCTTPALASFNESEEWNRTVVARRYPLVNLHKEKEGIYTGVQ